MDVGLHQPWGDPPGASTCNDHAAFASGCGPYLVRMSHGKKARPIQKDGTLQRVLLGGLGPAPAVGRPARRFHMQGTCGFLLGLRPVPSANDPRRKGPSDTEGRGTVHHYALQVVVSLSIMIAWPRPGLRSGQSLCTWDELLTPTCLPRIAHCFPEFSHLGCHLQLHRIDGHSTVD